MLSVQRFFPLLAIAVSLLAWYDPTPLTGLQDAIVPLLSITMFCMGLTLRPEDFQRVWRKPQALALGVTLQFLFMPLLAWLLAMLLQLPPELAVGLIVVGACAGGTASNVMTYLAGGDVALSVSLTLLSTLWGIFLTPWLIGFYAGTLVSVDTTAMLFSIAQIVLLPVTAGVLCNRFIPAMGKALAPHLADIASVLILLIIAIIVAVNAGELAAVGLLTLLAVMLHNLLGLGLGYGIARWNGQTEAEARTIALEVGMQNSGLGVALALQFFGPLAALPGALFSIWHNLSASLLVSFWKWQTQRRIRRLRS